MTTGTAWRDDTRRTQATEIKMDTAIVDVFRGTDDQVIVHLREYDYSCFEDHFRFSIDAVKEAVNNLELVSQDFTKVFIQSQDDSKSRRFICCLQGGRFYATNTIENAARNNFQVNVDWKEMKKALQKAWRKPR